MHSLMGSLRLALLAGVLPAAGDQLSATVITAIPTYIGGTVWRYDMSLSDFATGAGSGFSLYFPLATVTALANPVGPAGWDLLVFDPDSPPGANGVFDALALVALPLLTGFSVDATIPAGFAPLGLAFEIYQLSPFLILETGTTVPDSTGIPEPSTLHTALLFLAGAGIYSLRRGRR